MVVCCFTEVLIIDGSSQHSPLVVSNRVKKKSRRKLNEANSIKMLEDDSTSDHLQRKISIRMGKRYTLNDGNENGVFPHIGRITQSSPAGIYMLNGTFE